MPWIVSEGALCATRVGHCLSEIVLVIGVTGRALLGRCLCLQATVPVIAKASHAIVLLRDAGYLITRVVSINRCRINSLIPVQLIDLCQSPERIHRRAAPPARLVYAGHYFATCAAATAVDILTRPAIRVCSHGGPAFP